MFDDKSPESIKAEILADMEGVYDIREGSYTNNLVSEAAYSLWRMYNSLASVIPMVFVDETSGEYIDKKAAEYGITRKTGTKATCVLVITGTDNTAVPAGTAFLTAGGLIFYTIDAVTIADGTAEAKAEAEEVGEAYNVSAGEITKRNTNISGVTAVTNYAATGGTDPESDAALVTRLYEYMQRPATSGNAYHYIQWAKETNGVGYAKVIPAWDGGGTVKVIICSESLEPLDGTVVTACAEHIEEERPIGAEVTVVSASALEVSVTAAIALDGTAALEDIRSEFEKKLEDYFASIVFSASYISYNKLIYLLMSTDGVLDHGAVTLNGAQGNLFIGGEDVPKLKEVELTVYELE